MSTRMSRLFGRATAPQADVRRGERVLASATAADGTVLAGTRDAFYVVRDGETRRVAWEQVEAAGWDRDTDTFQLSEVGAWGEQRPVHTAILDDDLKRLVVATGALRGWQMRALRDDMAGTPRDPRAAALLALLYAAGALAASMLGFVVVHGTPFR